jgi:3-phosphoshikimate 1-carboxyvinyltransferase
MAAPYALEPLRLIVDGPLVSQPYVRMTTAVMSAFGAEVIAEGPGRYFIPSGDGYRGREYEIEPDASAASYFFAAAAIAGGRVTVEGLGSNSLQGDVRFVEVLGSMGCQVGLEADQITVEGHPLRGIEVDMNDISDTVQTLAAVALFAQGPTIIRGVAHIRHKETDRLAALATELRKFGAEVVEHHDGLQIHPRPLHGAQIATYDDHRMAMSMALVGLKVPGVVILDPDCAAKTYPGFFEDLAALATVAQ